MHNSSLPLGCEKHDAHAHAPALWEDLALDLRGFWFWSANQPHAHIALVYAIQMEDDCPSRETAILPKLASPVSGILFVFEPEVYGSFLIVGS